MRGRGWTADLGAKIWVFLAKRIVWPVRFTIIGGRNQACFACNLSFDADMPSRCCVPKSMSLQDDLFTIGAGGTLPANRGNLTSQLDALYSYTVGDAVLGHTRRYRTCFINPA